MARKRRRKRERYRTVALVGGPLDGHVEELTPPEALQLMCLVEGDCGRFLMEHFWQEAVPGDGVFRYQGVRLATKEYPS